MAQLYERKFILWENFKCHPKRLIWMSEYTDVNPKAQIKSEWRWKYTDSVYLHIYWNFQKNIASFLVLPKGKSGAVDTWYRYK